MLRVLLCPVSSELSSCLQERGKVLSRTLQARHWVNALLSAAAAMLSLMGNAQVLICKVEIYAGKKI